MPVFGETELGRRFQVAPELRGRIGDLKRDLDWLVLTIFEDTMAELRLPAERRTQVGRVYLEATQRLGFT